MTNYRRPKPRRQNDELLKGVFEENFPDFLRFLYPRADDIFDLGRGIQFMKALLEGKIPDQELGEDRLTIAKALLGRDYDRDRIISFLAFLKNFLYINDINDEKINSIFFSGKRVFKGREENDKS